LILIEGLGRVDEVDMPRCDAADARIRSPQSLEQLLEPELRQRGSAEHAEHAEF
jgi:hypothetical protein